MTQIVLATHNQHKVEELRRILAVQLPDVEVLAYDGPEPVENGATFAENALMYSAARRESSRHDGRVRASTRSRISNCCSGRSVICPMRTVPLTSPVSPPLPCQTEPKPT